MKTDNGGVRADAGKTEFHLIPCDALGELGRVYTFGAKKYAPRNWERGMLWSRAYNSLMRHLQAFWSGENRDAESQLYHLAHVAWNAVALLTYQIRGIGEDDRPGPTPRESLEQEIQERMQGAAGSTLSPREAGRLNLADNGARRLQHNNMRCLHCPNDARFDSDVCWDCWAKTESATRR